MSRILEDLSVVRAITAISLRAEQERDSRRPEIFVDPGIIPKLLNVNHQLLYGRRGTGKTHLLQRLRVEFDSFGAATAYIDARTFGSSHQFMDEEELIASRCAALFRDFLADLHGQLLDYIVDRTPGRAEEALVALDRLVDSISSPTTNLSRGTFKADRRTNQSTDDNWSAGLNLSGGPEFKAGESRQRSQERGQSLEVEFSTDDRVIFPAVSQHLAKVLELCGDLSLYVLLDEWSSLPPDIQPFMGEFLRRALLPVPGVTVKIAAIEHRTYLTAPHGQLTVGLEAGADISTAIDLDEHYIWEENESALVRAYESILYNHIVFQLKSSYGYLQEVYGVKNAPTFVKRLFEAGAFVELCQACSGVVRDFLAITSGALLEASRRVPEKDAQSEAAEISGAQMKTVRDQISVADVRRAGRAWFERDKLQRLPPAILTKLQTVEYSCLQHHKTRYFLVRSDRTLDSELARLLDARVLHRIVRSYTHPSRLGTRFDVYGLDYGSYTSVFVDSRGPHEKKRSSKHGESIRRSFKELPNPLNLEYRGPNSFGTIDS